MGDLLSGEGRLNFGVIEGEATSTNAEGTLCLPFACVVGDVGRLDGEGEGGGGEMLLGGGRGMRLFLLAGGGEGDLLS